MDDLVVRLSNGDHPVIAGGPHPSAKEFKAQLQRAYVFVKFTNTQGGTDLGVHVDKVASNWAAADFEGKTGAVHIEGTLILNDTPVRCMADLDLATLKGTGRLVVTGKA